MFPYSLLSETKQNKAKTPDTFSLNWLGYSVFAPSHCSALKLSDAIAAAFKYDCRFCLCSICLCGCSHSPFFPSLLPPLSSSYSLDPRQTEGAPLRRGTSPPSLPAELMVGLWGAGYKGGKKQRWRGEALICFILQFRTASRNFGGQVLK